jgi:hypothetical protein
MALVVDLAEPFAANKLRAPVDAADAGQEADVV